jgi:hypothetical protein
MELVAYTSRGPFVIIPISIPWHPCHCFWACAGHGGGAIAVTVAAAVVVVVDVEIDISMFV